LSPEEGRSRFAVLVLQDAPPLDQAMALLAVEEGCPAEPDQLLAALDRLAAAVRMPPEASVFDRTARLNHALFEERGFRGDLDRPHAPENSLLHRVLARRRGIPISLCAVMMEVARRVDFDLLGIGFPGHFLVRPAEADDPTFFIDPFNDGRILRNEELFTRLAALAGRQVEPAELKRALQPVSGRYMLVRMNNNLKGAYLRAGDVEAALRAVERLLLLAPGLSAEVEDRAAMLAHLGRKDEAVEVLETFLEHDVSDSVRERVQRRLEKLLSEG
jgi:regulator of sirC expression with transglutaminase-like and TPR domain